jgi:hypothetical protein
MWVNGENLTVSSGKWSWEDSLNKIHEGPGANQSHKEIKVMMKQRSGVNKSYNIDLKKVKERGSDLLNEKKWDRD